MLDIMTGAIPVLLHHQPDGWGGGYWWIGRLLTLLLLVALISFIVWRLARRGPTAIERARGILAERYARGELSAEEYRERYDALR
jgi:putative membrane protein